MSVERILDRRHMELLALFEQLSRARAVDLVEAEERMVFVVAKEDVGKAVGKGGSRLKRLREKMGRTIDIVAFSEDPAELMANYFRAFNVESVKVESRKDGTKVARVKVPAKDKGRAIGKGGQNVKLAAELVARHSDIANVVVDSGTVVRGA